MKQLIFGILLLLGVAIIAEDNQPIALRDFNGGLNLRSSVFQLKPNELLRCQDMQLDPLRKRKGFKAITDSLIGHKPLVGVYGAIKRDGSKRMYGVIDYTAATNAYYGTGQLIQSEKFSYSLDTATADTLYRYVYTGEIPSWLMWKDDIIMSNGRQRPIIVRNGVARDIVPSASGEPRIYPMNDSSNWGAEPNGIYRYAVLAYSGACDYWRLGRLSNPVSAYGEKILLTGFSFHTVDINCHTDVSNYDSMQIWIYRTRAFTKYNMNQIDTLWRVKKFNLYGSGMIDTLTFIDSIPDDSFGLGNYAGNMLLDTVKFGRNAAGTATERYGAPTYYARNYDTAFIFVETPADTFSNGTNKFKTLWTSYMITLFDTLIGIESDSSRCIYIYRDTIDTVDNNYIIGIPPIPGNTDHVIRRLYRSFSYTNIGDSSTDTTEIRDTVFCFYDWDRSSKERWMGYMEFTQRQRDMGRLISDKKIWTSPYNISEYCRRVTYYYDEFMAFAADTVTTDYFMISEIKSDTTKTFTDTISFDSMIFIGEAFIHTESPILKNLMVSDGRLWGTERSNIYWSSIDSASIWNIVDMLSLNPDDGDEITAIATFRNYMVIFKNYSKYVVRQSELADVEYEPDWVSRGFGCVASRSLAYYGNGLVYLSHLGVIYETGGTALEKATEVGNISENINSVLLNRTIYNLADAVGIVVGNEYRLSLPYVDTTWVYNFSTGGWSVWTYSFTQTTFYDTLKRVDLIPPTDILFINNVSDKIFRADTLYQDSGQHYLAKMKTAPIIFPPGYYGTISKFGLWRSATQTDSSATFIWIRNMNDSVVSTTIVEPYDTISTNYGLYGVKEIQSQYFMIEVGDYLDSASMWNVPADSIIINGLDIWVAPAGEILVR